MSKRHQPMIEIRIPSDANFVRIVRLAVSGLASSVGFAYDDIEDIKLAVSEACNNAIQHAHQNQKDTPVKVQCVIESNQLTMLVSDQGPGIPNDRAARISDPEQLSERGLGLFLMESLMDQVDWQDLPRGGVQVRLVKRIQR